MPSHQQTSPRAKTADKEVTDLELQKILGAIAKKWDNEIEKLRVVEVNGIPLLIVEDEDGELSCIGTIAGYATWPGMAELKGKLKAMEATVASLESDEDGDESESNELADLEFHDYIYEGVYFVIESCPNEILRYRRQDEDSDDDDDDVDMSLTGTPVLDLVCRMR